MRTCDRPQPPQSLLDRACIQSILGLRFFPLRRDNSSNLCISEAWLLGDDALIPFVVLGIDFANDLLDGLVGRGVAVLAVGDLEDVIAELGQDGGADVADLEREGGAGDGLDDDELVAEIADVAAPFLAGGAVGIFLGAVGEVQLAARDFLARAREKLRASGVAEPQRETQAWRGYARGLLLSNELLYVH